MGTPTDRPAPSKALQDELAALESQFEIADRTRLEPELKRDSDEAVNSGQKSPEDPAAQPGKSKQGR